MRRAALLSAAAACAWTACGAHAATISLEAGVAHRRLTEYDSSGTVLVRESGPMAQLAAGATWATPTRGTLAVGLAAAGGNLDYEGRTQGPAGIALESGSRHRDFSFAASWTAPPQAWGEPGIALTWLRQQRTIAATAQAGGLTETSVLALPGVHWTSPAWQAASLQWRAVAQLSASIDHSLKVDYRGVYDASVLDGARRREVRLGVQAEPAGSAWRFTAEWSRASQAASDPAALYARGVPVGTVRQPRLRIAELSMRLGRTF